jgi:hypothetical protein
LLPQALNPRLASAPAEGNERMAKKPFSLKAALKNLLGGAAIGGAIGLVALVRDLARGGRDEALPPMERTTDPAAPPPAAAEPAYEDERPAPAPLRPGWHAVEREPLPRPTYWPAALAFAIVLLAWGIATTWLISAVGAILLAASLAGWVGELLHDH